MTSHSMAADTCPANDLFPDALFPEVTFETSKGNIVVELDRQKAPATVNHFLYHLNNKALDDNLVHRVVKDYVIQTAAFKSDGSEVKSCGLVMNESGNGLKNNRGTIAMARYNDPHSASTSFYFNMNDNNNLDPNPKGWGYTVFGLVIEGMDVLEQINNEPVEYNSKLDAPNVPVVPIIIKKVTLNHE
ncbi:peptidylprolyl isomerase [Marinicella rhabdoformis]|uniref:peptidylprolyl isomerase n=1 Tax=Marinicella rhabdoformis TaxID=2580566 RepID=UPI0012AEBD57|nr:peptidylprolyl isomerase [Marinicella rhabdoformis]